MIRSSTWIRNLIESGPEGHLYTFERTALGAGRRFVAGVDEAGRGPLAGPLVAAAVMLSGPVVGVNDSKQLSEHARNTLYDVIMEGSHSVGVAMVDASSIDTWGIQSANYRAMAEAAAALRPEPDFLLVDGFRIHGCPTPQERIVRGDQRSASIAAASIIAKVTRDRIMMELDVKYPEYGFRRHKGYGTKAHFEALRRYGPCQEHRKSFAPLNNRDGAKPRQAGLFERDLPV